MQTAKTSTAPARKSADASDSQPKANSVRLDLAKLNALLDELDRRDMQNANANRQYVRWPFRHLHIPLTIAHLGGSRATIRVACRNISCGGISVLHSSYLYPGSRVELTLPHAGGSQVPVKGILARCSHLSGVIHEIGIKFDEPIRIADYVEVSPYAGAFSLERVDPAALRGTLIYIGQSELDQRLIRHYLRETQIRLHILTKPDEVIAKAQAGLDLIICDAAVSSKPETQILTQLRQAGIVTPAIVILPFSSKNSKPAPGAIKAEAFITKPFSQSVLLQAIAEFMVMDDGKGLTSSSLPPGHPSMMLVDSFISEVQEQARMLDEAVKQSRVAECLALCQQIAGVAPLIGFEKLGDLARQAETAVATSQNIELAVGEIRRLITISQNVRNRTE
ncbi:MAG: response regulator [Phycisphaerales bacterium]|nr:response regulator [Phycisphaerales bacterium]